MESGEPLEFSHSLEDQIGGQLDAGFVLTGLFEDRCPPDDDDPLKDYFPMFIATRAVKPRLGPSCVTTADLVGSFVGPVCRFPYGVASGWRERGWYSAGACLRATMGWWRHRVLEQRPPATRSSPGTGGSPWRR